MITLRFDSYYKKYVTRQWSRFRSPISFLSENYFFPKSSAIHFIPETNHEFGIDTTHSLMRNIGESVLIHHITELKPEFGRVRHLPINPELMMRNYHKRYKKFIRVRNLDKSMINDRLHMVVNYSLLPHMNQQQHHPLALYQEWQNMRACMWNNIKEMGDHRYHVIPFKVPSFLPGKNEFIKYSKEMTVTGLKHFHEKDQFDLLELWNILKDASEGKPLGLPDNIKDKILLVFIESNQIMTIQLKDLLEWAKENNNSILNYYYQFMDHLLALRTPVNTGEIIKAAVATEVPPPVPGSEKDIELEVAEIEDKAHGSEKKTDEEIEKELFEQATHIEELTDTDNIEEIIIAATPIEEKIQERAMAGSLSTAEQKGLKKLAERWRDIPNPFNPKEKLGDMQITKEDLVIEDTPIAKDSISIHDKSILKSRIQNFDKDYVKKVMHKDILNTSLSLQNAGLIVKNIKVTEKNTVATNSQKIAIQVQPVVGQVSTIHFTIPKIKEDGTFRTRGINYRMDKLRGELPIFKIKPYTVVLTSYYGKAFIVRNQNASTNYARWIKNKIVKASMDSDDNSITTVTHGINTFKETKLPRSYTAVADGLNGFTTPKYKFFFNYKKIDTFFEQKEIDFCNSNELIPCARSTMTSSVYVGINKEGILFEIKGKDINPIGTLPNVINLDWGNGPMEYAEVSVFNRRIPLVLALSYKKGLINLLKELKINYTSIPPTARYNASENTYRLKLKDESLIIDIRDPKVRLLIAGFNSVRKDIPDYTLRELDKKSSFGYLLARNGITNQHLRELSLMFDMFIDPITKELLEDMKEPNVFDKLLLRANELLVDDWVPEEEVHRFKGYERVSGMIYNQLVNSVRAFRSKGNQPDAEFTMNPMAVFLDIVQDQSITLIEDSNPIHNLKEKEAVTFSGQGGRSGETMVKSTRGFQKNDIGIISESTPDSGKVGIRTFMTANPNITNVRGIVREFNDEIDGPSSVISTSALLAPAVNHDDGKRANFISIHNSHTVMGSGYQLMPFRTGYEQVIANRVDGIFATKAKQDGVIIESDDKHISIQYKDGTTDVVLLGRKHGVVSGTTIPHDIITDLDKGNKVKANDIIAWNKGFFTRDLFNKGGVSYKWGTIGKTVLWESSDTTEDGCVVTKKFCDKIATNVSYKKFITIDFTTAIHNLIEVGTEVEHDSILCTLEDAITTGLDKSDKQAIAALQQIAAANPRAKTHGYVSNIDVIYFGNIEDMHPTLQEIVKRSDKKRGQQAKLLNDGSPVTGQIDEPIHFDTQKLTKGKIGITIYIDSELGITAGDKLDFANQLKSTISRVDTNGITTEDGTEVEAIFGYQSIADRIVFSPEITGTMNVVLKKLSSEMASIYKKG